MFVQPTLLSALSPITSPPLDLLVKTDPHNPHFHNLPPQTTPLSGPKYQMPAAPSTRPHPTRLCTPNPDPPPGTGVSISSLALCCSGGPNRCGGGGGCGRCKVVMEGCVVHWGVGGALLEVDDRVMDTLQHCQLSILSSLTNQ